MYVCILRSSRPLVYVCMYACMWCSPSRQSYHAYSSRCGQILEKLFIRLKTSFPSAVVVVKRGVRKYMCVCMLMLSVCMHVCMCAHWNLYICIACMYVCMHWKFYVYGKIRNHLCMCNICDRATFSWTTLASLSRM